MIRIVEATNKKEQKNFLNFPLKLYKNNPFFVPPLWIDEIKIFRDDYVYYDQSEAVYYNAYRDNVQVGRISGILQKKSNELRNEKRVRFTRFDSVDDKEVASALFDAVEKWAKSKGADTVCGPLGFSDLEREGLLIDGFDQLSTFEEQYNFPYYQGLIEGLGYEKEVDWLEFKIYSPDDTSYFKKMADFVMKRYNLHYGEAKNSKELIDKYAEKFFALLDESYSKIYGTVPFTDGMKKMMVDNFNLIIDPQYVSFILDENEKLVCLGVCFPSIAKAMQKGNGHLTPSALIEVLKAKKNPEILELGLIGVNSDYLNTGVNVAVCSLLCDMLNNKKSIDHAETNLCLEENHAILNQWKRFRTEQHKKRRSYVKKIGE